MKLINYFIIFAVIICTSQLLTGQNKSYSSDSIIIRSTVDSIQYGATITKPNNGKKFNAVIIVSGSGKQDRDGNMGGIKMFSTIADHLSKNGYLVVRMDDRGVGETTGDYSKSTTKDFAMDVLEIVKYLKNLECVNSHGIGLLGHSEGGAVMSIAASISGDIKFIISLSGLAMNGLDALITQNEAIVNNSPLKPYDKIRANEINGLMFKTAYQYADSTNMEEALNSTYKNWRMRDSVYFATLGQEYDHFRFPIWRYVNEATAPWYRFFVRYNSQLYLSQLNIPILAINGESDNFVVPSNLELWKQYSQSNPKRVDTHLLPKTNHLLQKLSDNPQSEKSEPTISKEALEIITNWLNMCIPRIN